MIKSNGNARLIEVTAANLRNGHLYLTGILDMFPPSVLGPASSRSGTGTEIRLDVQGLPQPVFTDIPRDASTGKPRPFFRRRSWTRDFFAHNALRPGDRVVLTRVSDLHYALGRYEAEPIADGRVREMFKAIDLFSGAGGLTLGLKEAGINPLAAVELRREAINTYKKHTPEAEHFCTDIRDVSFKKYRGAAQIVFGGPPCQPFSTGGLRKGARDSRNMIPAFLAAVEAVQPDVVLMENVPGLTVASRIHYLHDTLASIRKLGYQVTYRVLNAAHYGVPQKRRRLFVVGMRDRVFWFPKPTHGPECARPLVPTSTVVQLSQPLGEPPECPVVYARYPDPRPSPYAGQLYNGGGRPIDLDAPCHTILASAGGYKTHWVDTQNVAPRYHRHLLDGGERWEGTVPGARRLTVEESALIQTFPAWLSFSGSRSARYTQVGDAVPPLLAKVLGQAIVAQLNGARPSEDAYLVPVQVPTTFW
jgi:DNA (cytosine-5)-methyltransferase 1